MIVIGVSRCKQKTHRISRVDRRRIEYRYACMKVFFYEEGRFGTRYVKNVLEYAVLKAKVQRLRTFTCDICKNKYRSNKKGCPNCEY